MLVGMKSYSGPAPHMYTVLDGASMTGHVVELSWSIRGWPAGGQLYRDTGELHDHAQHGLVRWFRLVA